jgi:uncharacterized protein
MGTDEDKYALLLQTLKKYSRIAIAFSGGVDSTFLLFAAIDALGVKNVLPLYAATPLQSQASKNESRRVFSINFPYGKEMDEVEINPLSWQDVAANGKNRCYYCKRGLYTSFQRIMAENGYTVLADGTNCNDLEQIRPGLQAVRELQVATPLADVGLTKPEIRRLAAGFRLSNHDLPSNSCLATRVSHDIPLSDKILHTIELAEDFLHTFGFIGCRVRIYPFHASIEVLEKDITTLVALPTRTRIQAYFYTLNLRPVLLSLEGR